MSPTARCRHLVCLGCARPFPDWAALAGHFPYCDRRVQALLRALPPEGYRAGVAWLAREGPAVAPPEP